MAHQINLPSLIAFNQVSVMSIRADSVEWFYGQRERERERERESWYYQRTRRLMRLAKQIADISICRERKHTGWGQSKTLILSTNEDQNR